MPSIFHASRFTRPLAPVPRCRPDYHAGCHAAQEEGRTPSQMTTDKCPRFKQIVYSDCQDYTTKCDHGKARSRPDEDWLSCLRRTGPVRLEEPRAGDDSTAPGIMARTPRQNLLGLYRRSGSESAPVCFPDSFIGLFSSSQRPPLCTTGPGARRPSRAALPLLPPPLPEKPDLKRGTVARPRGTCHRVSGTSGLR